MTSFMKFSWKKEIVPLAIIVASILLSITTYPALPAKVASHWNFAGEVDGFSTKTFQAIFFPGIMTGLFLLFWILPYIDPKKANYKNFQKSYHYMKLLILLVFYVIYAATLLFNMGKDINIMLVVSGSIGIMLIILGYLSRDIDSNFFVGTKTPWTLSSPKVWKKTQLLNSWLLMSLGLIIIISPWLGKAGIYLFGIGIIATILIPTVYSAIIYKQLNSKK